MVVGAAGAAVEDLGRTLEKASDEKGRVFWVKAPQKGEFNFFRGGGFIV